MRTSPRRGYLMKGLKMLVLNREVGQGFMINNDIHVVLVEIRGKGVRLGIEAPQKVQVFRDEIHEKILSDAKREKENNFNNS